MADRDKLEADRRTETWRRQVEDRARRDPETYGDGWEPREEIEPIWSTSHRTPVAKPKFGGPEHTRWLNEQQQHATEVAKPITCPACLADADEAHTFRASCAAIPF